jgi:P4 family phage/plasmid primase-like protien
MPALKPLDPVLLVECHPFKLVCTEAGRSDDGLVGTVQWVNGTTQWLRKVKFAVTEDQTAFIEKASDGTDLSRESIMKALIDLANAIEAALRGKGSSPKDDRPENSKPDPKRIALVKAIGIAPALARDIQADDHFAQDFGERLYRYHHGVYVPDGAAHVKRRVKSLLDGWRMSDEWSSHVATETAEYLRVDAPYLWDDPPNNVVNVHNGLLNVHTSQLQDHSPEYLSTCQLPISYDDSMKCPRIEAFIGEIFPADSIEQAWEIFATIMLPTRSLQKAILLYGTGGNGKGVFLRLLMAFLGKYNITSMSLQKLEMDRFAVARLVGKMANICPDLPSTHLEETAVFKSLTGGDHVTGEYKYKESFDFRPYARLLFSANHYPRSSDDSEGFFDRWHVIPFERSFRGTDQEIPSDTLDRYLSTPDELSGALNKALEVLPRVSRRGLSTSDSTRKAFDEFRKATDPLAVWFERATNEYPGAIVPQDELLQRYNKDCDTTGRPRISAHAMTKAMKRWRTNITLAKRTWNGTVKWCWVGIGLRANEQNDNEKPTQ